MATRTRDAAVPGKDKTLTSPSKLSSARRKIIPNPTATASASASASNPLPKRTPTNLRPTAAAPVKKPASGSGDIASKNTVVRRRSLDTPPTASNPQSSRVSQSPTVRRASISGRIPQARPSLSPTTRPSTARPVTQSSSMGRSTPSTRKAIPDGGSKAPKEVAGKQHSLQNRPVMVKKSTTVGVKKPEARRGGPSGTKESPRPRISPIEKAANMHTSRQVGIESQDRESELSSTDAAEQESVEIGKSNEKGHSNPAMEYQEKGAEKPRLEEQEVENNERTEEAQKDNEEDQIAPPESSRMLEARETVLEPKNTDEDEADIERKTTDERNVAMKTKEVEITPSSKISHNDISNVSMENTEDKSNTEELKEESVNEPDNFTSGENAASNASKDTNPKVMVEEHPTGGETKAKEVFMEPNKMNETVSEAENSRPEESKGNELVVEKKEEPEESKAKELVMESNNVKEKADETLTGGKAPQPEETIPKEVVPEKKAEEKPAPTPNHWKLQKRISSVSNEGSDEAEKQAPRAQVVGKLQRKDSVVSNDVIEETANKLHEQRKNRVRALAGAFESVISLQDSKS